MDLPRPVYQVDKNGCKSLQASKKIKLVLPLTGVFILHTTIK